MNRTLPLVLALTTLALAACSHTGTVNEQYGTSSSSSDSMQTSSEVAMTPSSSSPSTTMSSSTSSTLSGKHTVTLKTSMGDITLELDADMAPMTVTNFVTHAKDGYYNNLTFHRVIPGFMIQGGDPSGNGTGGKSIYGDTFEDEIDPSDPVYATYKTGTLAMANRGPNTNGSQFFIMEADVPLPPSYTIFGRVVSGQSVVSQIANVPRDGRDMPLTPVTFTPAVK